MHWNSEAEQLARLVLFFALLSVLLVFPAVLLYEYSNDYSQASGPMVRAVVSLSSLVLADVTFFSEVTPAAAAIGLAALSPRPIGKWVTAITLVICIFGYLSFAWLQLHINGQTVVLQRSMQAWIESAIEGHVAVSVFDDAISDLISFCSSLRIFYMMVGASVIGFIMNPEGRGVADK